MEVEGVYSHSRRWRLRGIEPFQEMEVEGVYSHSRKTSTHGAKLRCYDQHFSPLAFESNTFLALKSTKITQIELQSTSLGLNEQRLLFVIFSKIFWCLEYGILQLLGYVQETINAVHCYV